ncbi:MAG: putative Rieske 2Fe-2S iron-sulfur protein [Nitrosomonadaceae bacterium]|nr:putative Rieske 2Fe-2S iron-sulfur protein [Nitrosomonadaceae bacterium]
MIARSTGNGCGIAVRYIYSACIVTTTKDVSILHDPWFTEGIYDGSWFHYPKVLDPIKSIGDVDVIYISHIHPDHYDVNFLRKYFSVYGAKEVIIADHSPNHLAGKMRADGIKASVLQNVRRIGNTEIEILPHKTGSISDIDSAMVLKYFDGSRAHCVVNANDIIFNDAMIASLKSVANEPDILLCGYTGAGPYPQTYFDLNDPCLCEEARKKKLAFFERYKRLTDSMNAKVNIPFAGKYLLGGRLAALNKYRGIADQTEILALDERAVVLADDGGEMNTAELKPSAVRTQRYDARDIERRENEIAGQRMDYERLIPIEEIRQLPLKRLLISAARRASKMSECETDYFFIFSLPGNETATVNANKFAECLIDFSGNNTDLPQPRSKIVIDPRYLFGLLTNVYHWNNAEVGSQYSTRRTPNVLNRKAQSFLNYLAI